MRLLGPISVVFLLAILAPARSALILSLNSTMPSSDVAVSYVSGTPGGYQWRNDTSSGLRDVGQSFLATTSFTMDAFSVQLNGNIQSGDANASVTTRVFESTTASSIGTLIATDTGVFPNASGGAGQWLTFNMADVALTAGHYYTVMLSWDAQAANRNLVLNGISSGTYSDGMVWISTNGTDYVSGPAGLDFLFVVQSSVPEPGSLSLAMMAGMVLLGLRGRFLSRRFQ